VFVGCRVGWLVSFVRVLKEKVKSKEKLYDEKQQQQALALAASGATVQGEAFLSSKSSSK
jgi:hypothetical protein